MGDSPAVSREGFQVYMLRTATLVAGPKLALGWKMVHGTVEARRVDDSTPEFAEMAMPGTRFEGEWTERAFFQSGETARSLHWREPLSTRALFDAANQYAAIALANHKQFATVAGLAPLAKAVEALESRLEAARSDGACLVSLGWGAGLLGKTAWPKVEDEAYRRLMSQQPYYARAIRSGLPFPKTRRVVFVGGQPASLPGWVVLRVG